MGERFKQAKWGELHVIVAARIQDNAVGLFYTRDPKAWLAAIGTHMQLGAVETRPAAAAVKVVESLRRRFAIAHTPSDAFPWYLIDFAQAIAALNAIDLNTGDAARDLELQQRVFLIPERVRARVFGFTKSGRVVIQLENAPDVANLVIARRENLKPILRAKSAP